MFKGDYYGGVGLGFFFFCSFVSQKGWGLGSCAHSCGHAESAGIFVSVFFFFYRSQVLASYHVLLPV